MVEVTVDHYKLTGIIGRGGMGAIYYGEDLDLKRPVAVKMVRPDLSANSDLIERFYAEALTTASLNHPNIATVYGLVRQNSALLLVMEFIRGWTLSQVLRICDRLPPQQAITVMKAALAGIGYAHEQKVIHRDLKTTNLMLNQNGLIKVMDFGIARLESGPEYTHTGQLVGTLEYMSPEQIRGGRPDIRTDIYALGIVLYRLLTGRVPFDYESDYQLMKDQVEKPPPPPKQFVGTLSDQLQAVVLKALSKSVEKRHKNAQDFADALERCPENSGGAVNSKLDALIARMKSTHPLAIKPLNQSAADELSAFISRRTLPPQVNGRQDASDEVPVKFKGLKQQKLVVLFLLLAIAISGLTAFLFIKGSPETNGVPTEEKSGFGQATQNGGSMPPDAQASDGRTSPPEQQKESEWIIIRRNP